MTQIIKDAFVEGRETETEWEQSEALRNQVKLDTFAANTLNFNRRSFRSLRPLEQVCPNTGKVLNTFGSRIDAARWIISNVMKTEDPTGKKATSITGNMHMCTLAGFKSYGYYWREINPEQRHAAVMQKVKALRSRAIQVFDCRNPRVKPVLFASIKEASESIGIPTSTMKDHIGDTLPPYKGYSLRFYNAKLKERKFKTKADAATFFGVPESYISNVMATSQTINNVKMVIAEKTHRVVNVVRNRKNIESFLTMTEAGAYLGVNRFAIAKAIKDNRKIGDYRVTVSMRKHAPQ